MSELFKIVKSVIAEFSKHLTGAKIKEFESEDPLSKNLLANHLCSTNSKRIVFFMFPAILAAIVFAVSDIKNFAADSRLALISLISIGVIVFCCGFLSVIIYREYKKRKPDLKKLKRCIFLFWTVFSASMLLMTVSDFSINVFSYRFYFYLIVMTIFPLLNLKEAILIILPYLAFYQRQTAQHRKRKVQANQRKGLPDRASQQKRPYQPPYGHYRPRHKQKHCGNFLRHRQFQAV